MIFPKYVLYILSKSDIYLSIKVFQLNFSSSLYHYIQGFVFDHPEPILKVLLFEPLPYLVFDLFIVVNLAILNLFPSNCNGVFLIIRQTINIL